MEFIKNLQRMKKIYALLVNIMVFCQIIFLLAIAVFSLYIFLHLLNVTWLDFINPIVEPVKAIVRFFFGSNLHGNIKEVDGELAASIILSMILAFGVLQLKIAFEYQGMKLDKQIIVEKRKLEENFNRDLNKDVQKSVVSNNTYMLGVKININPLVADSMQIYGEKPIDTEKLRTEASAKFLAAVRSINGINVAQVQDNIYITSTKFDSIDGILLTVQNIIKMLKREYSAQKAKLKARLAIECYRANTPLDQVYGVINPLLELNLGSEALCLGNFKNRYAMVKDPKCKVQVKGAYDFKNAEELIYSLVKKEEN